MRWTWSAFPGSLSAFLATILLALPDCAFAQDPLSADSLLAKYFTLETTRLEKACLHDIADLETWKNQRAEYHAQLMEMLGLNPFPEKTALNTKVTGLTEHDEFIVENVQFQSRPGLYVTGNLYRPKSSSADSKLPAILYVCGHARVKEDGVSYGNKVAYHHHGSWFARNGYVCLTIDTLQLGEIEGIHHGTYREKMWWWLNRGYTPAGVEAWNCIRALDYLQSRPEVDGERLGVTGRSGGGAYSWWIAAIDERIKCAVPVAGITDLRNHVIDGGPGRFADGCVEGHCDCMYMVNTYQWDYPLVAAMVAPRALMISNTDRDSIFPLDGVYRTHAKVRDIYRLYDAEENLAFNITSGPHKDTQELRVNAFHWFNHHLKNDDTLIEEPAVKFFEPEQLRVFQELPTDQKNSEIHETFVPTAEASIPESTAAWDKTKTDWREALETKVFGGWPMQSPDLNVQEVFESTQDGITLKAVDFTSQEPFALRLYIAQPANSNKKPDLIVLNVLDEAGWSDFLATMQVGFKDELQESSLPEPDAEGFADLKKMFGAFNWAMAYVAPRGVGRTAWDPDERKQTQHRRRFYLLGQSLNGMQTFDVRRAIQTIQTREEYSHVPLWLQSEGPMAGITLYASLFEDNITRLDLHNLPTSHRQGPFYLNVRRFLDMPQAVALAAERSQVVLYHADADEWSYPVDVAKKLEWNTTLQIRKPVE